MELLAERGRLRTKLHSITPDLEPEAAAAAAAAAASAAGSPAPAGSPAAALLLEVQADLHKLTKLLSTTRQHQWDETSAQLTQEVHEAWQRRDMKTSFALMRRLAGSKFDVKNETGGS